MVTREEAKRFLAQAAARVGGMDALAGKLDIGPHVLEHYLNGQKPVPESLVLRIIDVVLDADKPPSS